MEDALNHAVCSGRVKLVPAQEAIASNWTTAEGKLGLSLKIRNEQNKFGLSGWGYVIAGLIFIGLMIATHGGILGIGLIVVVAIAIKRHRAKQRALVPPPAPKPRNSFHYGEPGKGFTVSVCAANMRVTDKERDAVAEELSRQFGIGRLDRATFDSRLNTAMSATVRWELDLMLVDLPIGDLGGTRWLEPSAYSKEAESTTARRYEKARLTWPEHTHRSNRLGAKTGGKMASDWDDYNPIPMDAFPHPASYYKQRLGWCVVDDCDEDATGEVKGLLVCDEHKSDAEGGEMTVIELINGVPYIYTQGEVI